MPTPEAIDLADRLWDRWQGSIDHREFDVEKAAEEIDRFAAQRGADWQGAVMRFAEAILHGDDKHQQWLRAAAKAYVNGNEIPLVPPQTGGGAAEERARAAVEALPSRLFDRKHTEEIVLHLVPEFEAALREGAKAMREACARWHGTKAVEAERAAERMRAERRPTEVRFYETLAARHIESAHAIRALPIPGKTDAVGNP